MSDAVKQNWVIIPAAGIGKRMGAAIPKQYLQLNGKTVLDNSIERFINHKLISGIVVAVADGDLRWSESLFAKHEKVMTVAGGDERCHSVLNALNLLAETVSPTVNVLVHDAARPCVLARDITLLIERLAQSSDGGLLGMRVRDTMKRSDATQAVRKTVERENLWHAFTPQMFRLDLLKQALQKALDNDLLVTDDASAMELAGYHPLMIEGSSDNIKITRPEDLSLAAYFLDQQSRIAP